MADDNIGAISMRKGSTSKEQAVVVGGKVEDTFVAEVHRAGGKGKEKKSLVGTDTLV